MKSTSNIMKGIFHNLFIDDNGKVCEYSSLIIGSFVKNQKSEIFYGAEFINNIVEGTITLSKNEFYEKVTDITDI